MAQYSIASSNSAEDKGLSPPFGKNIHVVDTKAKSIVFSTNSLDRAGKFESAKEKESFHLGRADGFVEQANNVVEQANKQAEILKGEAAREKGEAAGYAARADAVIKEDGQYTKMGGAIRAVGYGGATAAAGIALNGALSGASDDTASVVLLIAAAAAGAALKKQPQAQAAVVAGLVALGVSRSSLFRSL